jgi:hypothetical protein
MVVELVNLTSAKAVLALIRPGSLSLKMFKSDVVIGFVLMEKLTSTDPCLDYNKLKQYKSK